MTPTDTDGRRRRVLATSVAALGGTVLAAFSAVLVNSLRPSRATEEANRKVVDTSRIKPGEFLLLESGNKPIVFFHRTQEQLRALEHYEEPLADPMSRIAQQPDFATNRFRSKVPELLVVEPICTRLGCAVKYAPADDPYMNGADREWHGGFNCPCHAALFDLAGRVYRGMPAPVNLRVPPRNFISKHEVEFGPTVHEL